MTHGLERLAKAARAGATPGGVIRDGGLNIDRLAADPPEGADELILDLYKRIPDTRITDILMDVDDAIGFTDAFVHLRTGAPCKDKIGLLNVLLAEGVNLSIGKMAESTNTHDYLGADAAVALAGRWRSHRPCPRHGDRGTGQVAHGGILGSGNHRVERRPVLSDHTTRRGHEFGQCQIR